MRIRWKDSTAEHVANMALRSALDILDFDGHVPPEILADAEALVGFVRQTDPMLCGWRECAWCKKYLGPLPDIEQGHISHGVCQGCAETVKESA